MASNSKLIVVPPSDVIADHLTVIVRAPVGLRGRRPAPFTARLWRKVNWDAVCMSGPSAGRLECCL